jgi:hypothetical protein
MSIEISYNMDIQRFVKTLQLRHRSNTSRIGKPRKLSSRSVVPEVLPLV